MKTRSKPKGADLATDSALGSAASTAVDYLKMSKLMGNSHLSGQVQALGTMPNMTLGALGVVGGVQQTAKGIGDFEDGNYGDGVLNTAAGVGSTGSGALAMLGVGSEVAAGATLLEAGLCPVLGAVGGGAALGITLGQRANGYSEKNELFGRSKGGKARTLSDSLGDLGGAAFREAKDLGLPEWAAQGVGGATTLASSVASTPAAAVLGVADLTTDIWNWATD